MIGSQRCVQRWLEMILSTGGACRCSGDNHMGTPLKEELDSSTLHHLFCGPSLTLAEPVMAPGRNG
jgi:hypothetical protein